MRCGLHHQSHDLLMSTHPPLRDQRRMLPPCQHLGPPLRATQHTTVCSPGLDLLTGRLLNSSSRSLWLQSLPPCPSKLVPMESPWNGDFPAAPVPLPLCTDGAGALVGLVAVGAGTRCWWRWRRSCCVIHTAWQVPCGNPGIPAQLPFPPSQLCRT